MGNQITPDWSDLYFALEDSKNPLHFLFRNNADFSALAAYLHELGFSRKTTPDGEWVAVMDAEQLFNSIITGVKPNIIAYYKCSVCGRREATKKPFCNCGAKMKE